MRISLLILLVCCGGFAPLHAATIIIGGSVQNGNFETVAYWGGPDGKYITDPASALEGARFLQASFATQRFFVYPENGLEFELSFYARAGSQPLDEISVSFSSFSTTKLPESIVEEAPVPSNSWQRYTTRFIFREPWSPALWNLDFRFLQGGRAVPGQIDAVTFTQVPEPGGPCLLICGGLVVVARGGRKKVAGENGGASHTG